MKYYEVQRTRTCKAVFSSFNDYYTWDTDIKQFKTIAECKKFLKDEYGKCKRDKMYIDDEAGKAKHIGYIYCFNTPKASYDDTPKNNQDWVMIKEIHSTTILI